MLISKIGKEVAKKTNYQLMPIISKYRPPKLDTNKFYKQEFKFFNVPQNEQMVANMNLVQNAKQHANEFVKNFKKEIDLEIIKSKQEEDAKSYYKRLTEKISNKTLLTNILTLLSFSALVYFDINSEKKIKSIKSPIKSSLKTETKTIEKIKNLFFSIIERIKDFSIFLYNSLKETFNIFIKIPKISYKYITYILEQLDKIYNVSELANNLYNFNILCKNIIIITSKQTIKLIAGFSTVVYKFARLAGGKIGEIAINNLIMFKNLFALPNVNKEELFATFNNFIKYLGLEIILIKARQLVGLKDVPKNEMSIFENNFKKLYEDFKDYFTENINNKLTKQEKKANEEYDGFINKILSLNNPIAKKLVEKIKTSSDETKNYLYFQINKLYEKYKNVKDDAIIKEYQYLINLP
jgi:hypothetical protein